MPPSIARMAAWMPAMALAPPIGVVAENRSSPMSKLVMKSSATPVARRIRHDAVDILGRQARIGDGRQRGLHLQGDGAFVRPFGIGGLADPGDSAFLAQ